jgi:hypothetical protein
MGQVSYGAVDLASCIVEVDAFHQRRGSYQTPASTLGNSQNQIQIA